MTKCTPDRCECGSDGFIRVYFRRKGEQQLGPDTKGEQVRGEGWKCIECGALQLTREIPEPHASADSLDLPASADRDMVRED